MTAAQETDVSARITASFNRQTMMASLGATLDTVGPGVVTIAASVGPGFRQQQGAAHAGLVFALGDSAAGYAALTLMAPGVEVMTVEMKINLLRPGSGSLLAEGRVVKAGRRLMVVAADVWSVDEGGGRKHVATLQGTMIPVSAQDTAEDHR